MNPAREALFALLDGDEALSAMATGGIHYQRAPKGTKYPYVVFSKTSGRPVWSFGGDPFSNQLWLVKGLCRGGSASDAEAIDARCAEVLNDANLEIEGQESLYLRRESEIPDYPEDDGGETIFHVGGQYRLYTEPT